MIAAHLCTEVDLTRVQLGQPRALLAEALLAGGGDGAKLRELLIQPRDLLPQRLGLGPGVVARHGLGLQPPAQVRGAGALARSQARSLARSLGELGLTGEGQDQVAGDHEKGNALKHRKGG